MTTKLTISMWDWQWEEIKANAEKDRKREAKIRKNIRENNKELKDWMKSIKDN